MIRKILDWKFALTTLIALAVPYYFSQADLSSHALTVRLVSSSALELPSDSKFHEIQITVNGTKVEAPHISSVTLSNTGSKPIVGADFETPIEVSTQNDTKLITAQITGTEPADIPAQIFLEDNKLKFRPFLSNPQDQVNVTIVSSGPLNLKVAGRIAGVRDIPFEDLTQAQPRPGVAAVTGLISVISLTLYLFFLGITDFRSVTRIGPRVKIPTTLVVVMSGVYFGSKTATELGLTSYYAAANMAVLFAIAWVFAAFLTRSNHSLNSNT